MTPEEISVAKGGEVFDISYAGSDIADTFSLQPGNWGIYTTTGGVVAEETVHPAFDDDGFSIAGTWVSSISLGHLTTKSSAHVFWEGSGITVAYTLNGGGSWTTISQPTAIALTGSSDLDIRITFAGGIEDDTATLESLTVYILATDTLRSPARTLTFSADLIDDDGIHLDAPATISAGMVGTVEVWVKTGVGITTVFDSPPAGANYRNGAALGPIANTLFHFVRVLTTPASTPLTLSAGNTITHVALYDYAMSVGEVATLYAAQNASPILFNDSGSVTVAEDSPPAEIYAYSWSIVSGGR